MDKLATLLRASRIDLEPLLDALYKDIVDSILEQILRRMRVDKNYELYIRQCYHNMDDQAAARRAVATVCNLVLPADAIAHIGVHLIAAMRRRDRRAPITQAIRARLLAAQDNKCAICGCPITLANMHVDHIAPWVYVGDALDNNLQGLCPACNHHKGTHMATHVSTIIFHQ